MATGKGTVGGTDEGEGWAWVEKEGAGRAWEKGDEEEDEGMEGRDVVEKGVEVKGAERAVAMEGLVSGRDSLQVQPLSCNQLNTH